METFTVGTRLTHVTRALGCRDAEQALVAAGEAVPDWSGGTRLGETLKSSSTGGAGAGWRAVRWSSSSATGGSGETPPCSATRCAGSRRLAHRVVWVTPIVAGRLPARAAGILAVLPHVDDFVAGHSFATFAD